VSSFKTTCVLFCCFYLRQNILLIVLRLIIKKAVVQCELKQTASAVWCAKHLCVLKSSAVTFVLLLFFYGCLVMFACVLIVFVMSCAALWDCRDISFHVRFIFMSICWRYFLLVVDSLQHQQHRRSKTANIKKTMSLVQHFALLSMCSQVLSLILAVFLSMDKHYIGPVGRPTGPYRPVFTKFPSSWVG